MKELSTSRELDSVIADGTAIVYKHSTQCPISAAAHRQLDGFLERNPDVTIHKVDVHAASDLSDYLERKTGIAHQSPQLMLFRDGKVEWEASRMDITAEALEQQLQR